MSDLATRFQIAVEDETRRSPLGVAKDRHRGEVARARRRTYSREGVVTLLYASKRRCCTNRARDSLHESSMIAGKHEQLGPYEVQDHELVGLQ